MTERKFEFTDAKGGVAFTVRCVTRSARTEAAGIQEDGTIKVRLQASPAGSPEANQELVTFLAATLSVNESQIEIVAGLEGRDKLVSVEGITQADIQAKISQFQEE